MFSDGPIVPVPDKKKGRKKKPKERIWPKIRETKIKGHIFFVVDARPFRSREYFAYEDEAITRAGQLQIERKNKGTEALDFPTELRVAAIEGDSRLRPYGRTIQDAINHYIEWLEEQARKENSRTVSSCLDLWLDEKRAERDKAIIATTTFYELESRGKIIRSALGSRRIVEMDEDTVKTFLDSLPYQRRTVYNIRTKLGQFLNFCKRKKWITQNPVEEIEIKVRDREIAILSVAEVKKLLKAAMVHADAAVLVPFLVLGMFVGLRPGEAEKIEWDRIHFDTGEVEVLASTSKTRETRFVPMEPTALAWLKKYKQKAGRVIGRNFPKKWNDLRKSCGYAVLKSKGVKWHPDVLRHTFGSYWLAVNNDRPRLGELMGNTVDVIKAHYRRAVRGDDAASFWEIDPESLKKKPKRQGRK